MGKLKHADVSATAHGAAGEGVIMARRQALAGRGSITTEGNHATRHNQMIAMVKAEGEQPGQGGERLYPQQHLSNGGNGASSTHACMVWRRRADAGAAAAAACRSACRKPCAQPCVRKARVGVAQKTKRARKWPGQKGEQARCNDQSDTKALPLSPRL